MKKNKCLFLLLFMLVAGIVRVSAESMSYPLFSDAAELYKQGKYDEAIKKYEEIVSAGQVSGNIYFNLGNSYFKNGNVGRAILNYERALMLMPRDSDLEANYIYVKEAGGLFLYKAKDNILYRGYKGYRDDFSNNELSVLTLILYFLCGMAYIVLTYLKMPKKRFLAIIAPVAILFIINVVVLRDKIRIANTSYISIKKTQALFEPNPSATVHYKVKDGEKLYFVQKEGEWLKVRREDGKVGWIWSEDVEKI